MKKIGLILLALVGFFTFNSCEDVDKDPVLVVGNAPELTVPTNITMALDNANDEVTFSWSQGVYDPSVAVTYTLQVDKSGNNFADMSELYVGGDEEFTMTVGELNTKILGLGLEIEVAADLEFRVVSWINDNVADLVSETTTLNLTPFATVFPPIYMIGAATGGWNTALAVEVSSSAPNVYSTIAHFVQGEAFRFFAQPDWGPTSYNYPHFTGSVTNLLENAEDGDKNFKVVGETGYYRITANLKTLTVEMEAVDEPIMYMTGAAIGGWDQPGTGASIKMTFVKENVWKATATFVNGEAFRFFAQAGWGPTSYNFPFFADGSVSSLFEDAGDGDNNFRFVGTAGEYDITLNLSEKTVVMESK